MFKRHIKRRFELEILDEKNFNAKVQFFFRKNKRSKKSITGFFISVTIFTQTTDKQRYFFFIPVLNLTKKRLIWTSSFFRKKKKFFVIQV